MYYIDSNMLISYVFVSEKIHKISQKSLEKLAEKQKLYTSSFAILESCNALCRKIARGEKIVDPLQIYIDRYKNMEEKCRFLTSFFIKFLEEKLRIKIIDEKAIYEPININNITLPKIFYEALKLSSKINIRTKDIIHLTYVSLFSKILKINIKYFLTHDIENFQKIRNRVKKLLQIEIILIKTSKDRKIIS